MKAIVGNFTGQDIMQEIKKGKTLIELPYHIKEVPDYFCHGTTIAYTQKPSIVDDRGKLYKGDFLNELHIHLSLNLHHFVDGHFDVEISEFDTEPDPEIIKFVLVEALESI